MQQTFNFVLNFLSQRLAAICVRFSYHSTIIYLTHLFIQYFLNGFLLVNILKKHLEFEEIFLRILKFVFAFKLIDVLSFY